MADKSISELVAASAVNAGDLFVLEQNNVAKKLTGQILENWLVSFADGHGGIQTVAKTGTSGLVDTYTITYADTTTSTFTVTNGAKGDTGAASYVYIRYSHEQPGSDSDIETTFDNWMGIAVTTSPTAPTHYTDYTWGNIKGAKGDTGNSMSISSQSVTYQASESGTVTPLGTWSDSVPTVAQGSYLWTRTVVTYADNTVITSYSVGRMGIDGTGTVASVNNILPVGGNITLEASDVGAEAVRLQFTNTSVATTAFVADATYEDFPYRAAITLTGVLATMTPEVVLGVADAMSGDFAPVAECYAGGVYIYAAAVPDASLTIPTIVCWKAVS